MYLDDSLRTRRVAPLRLRLFSGIPFGASSARCRIANRVNRVTFVT